MTSLQIPGWWFCRRGHLQKALRRVQDKGGGRKRPSAGHTCPQCGQDKGFVHYAGGGQK